MAGSIVRAIRVTANEMRHRERLRRAARKAPARVDWDWARPRLVPLLAGPYLGQPGEGLVRAIAPCRVAVVFGVDLGGVCATVDEPIAERCECTSAQLFDTAMHNLRARAARIDRSAVTSGTFSGRIVRLLRRPAGWASSVLLVPQELVGLFGAQDQLFTPIGQSTLLSFAIDTPPAVVAEIASDLEMDEVYPLLLDPFALIDGKLTWGGETDGV